MAKEMKKKSQICIKCLFNHALHILPVRFHCIPPRTAVVLCSSDVFAHGCRWFHATATFWQAEPTKTRVQELTRTSILGHSHTQVKIVVPVVGVVVVPIGTSGVVRIVVPAATAFDAVRTGSIAFFCPYRLIHCTINDLIIHFAICLPVVFCFCFLLYCRQSKSIQRLHRLNKYNVQWSTS